MEIKRIVFFVLFFCVTFNTKAQKVIRGLVVSIEGNVPLEGVSINILGSEGTIFSDENGMFNLILEKNRKVVDLSLLGFEGKRIIVNDSLSFLNISLFPKPTELKEVIVSTGYQHIPKERSTGSFEFIDNKTFNQQVGMNVLDRLEAITNSLMVDNYTNAEGGKLMIRGLSTIRGPKEPLIVLDNFPYEGDINNINPNDVESITILKDAAASSIWGTRAGNGVIVITTKRGTFNQPLKISFNSNLTVSERPDLYMPMMKSNDFIEVEKFLFGEGYYDNQIASDSKPPLSPVVELLIAGKNNLITNENIELQINRLRDVNVRDEIEKYFYSPSYNQQYSLAIRGGGSISRWSLSTGYDRNISTQKASSDRITLNLNHSIKPLENLQLSAGINYTNRKSNSGNLGVSDIGNGVLYPYSEFADSFGNSLPFVYQYRQEFVDLLDGSKLLDWSYYPLDENKYTDAENSINDILINAGGIYKHPIGINAEIMYQYERQHRGLENHYGVESYFARNLINNYTQIGVDGEPIYKLPKGDILDISDNNLRSHNIRGQLNFNKNWASHSLISLIGSEVRQALTKGSGYRIYGFNSDIFTHSEVDYANQYPGFVTGFKSFIPSRNSINEGEKRFISVYGNTAYTYGNKYTISLSGRRDASNMFGVKANNKWKPLWSSGLSWNISNEHFYSSTILPYLRLRVTYGTSGNTDLNMTALTTIRYGRNSPYTLNPTAQFDSYSNPELRWETVETTNLGLDFSFKDNRIRGSVEVYKKVGKDLFGVYPLDYTAGVGATIVRNVAEMKGSGIDLSLSSINTTGFVKWNSDLNLSSNNDEITKYYLSSKKGSNFINGGVSGLEGSPVFSIFSFKWNGLDSETGKPIGYLNEEESLDYPKIMGDDTQVESLILHGSALPTLFGSLGNSLVWKNLSLDFRVVYKFGYYFKKESIDYGALLKWHGHEDFEKRWQNKGDEKNTNVPAFIYPIPNGMDNFYRNVSSHILKGDNIRLQYINIGYTFSKNTFRSLPFSKVYLYCNINNVGMLWAANKEGIDPMFYKSNSIVTPRIYAMGLKLDFN